MVVSLTGSEESILLELADLASDRRGYSPIAVPAQTFLKLVRRAIPCEHEDCPEIGRVVSRGRRFCGGHVE